jgi:chromosome segregation ATPase
MIQGEIAALEQELARVQDSVAETDAALAQLEEQREETEGRLALARRAQADVEQRLRERRVEFERAEAEAAVEAYEGVLRERALAADALVSAVEAIAAQLSDYEAANERAADAWSAVSARRLSLSDSARKALKQPDREPPRVGEAREMLVELVRPWLDREHASEIEAAARSPMGHGIEKLPEHLRVLARERRNAILRGSRGRG